MKKSTLTDFATRIFGEQMKDVGTSIPGHILKFDPDTQLAELQVGIKRIDKDGTQNNPTPIIQCPIHFPGGDWCIEYEINEGDEGIIIFSQRCIDAWVDQGGIATQPIIRFHDRNDAMFIPGVRSGAKVISDFQNNGIRMKDRSGTWHIWLKNNGDGEFKLNNCNIQSNTLTHNGTNVGDTHNHPQANDSGGNTEQDTGGPQ